MFTKSRTPSIRRNAVAVAAALCLPLAVSASAMARPADGSVAKPASHAKAGDTQADFGKTFVVPEPKAGDTPVDFPGASRAAATRPTEIVRPAEPTIVSDDAPGLPLILAGLALLAALAGGAQLMMQRRKLQTQ